MSTLAQATAAPEPVTLGDKTYDASPLTLADLGALEGRVKSAILSEAAKAAENMTPGQAEMTMSAALTKVVGVTYRSAAMVEWIKTPAGMVALVCLSLRRRHPDVDEREVAKVYKDNFAQFSTALDTIDRISEATGDVGGSKPGEAVAGA